MLRHANEDSIRVGSRIPYHIRNRFEMWSFVKPGFRESNDIYRPMSACDLSIDRILVTMFLGVRRELATEITPIPAERFVFRNLSDESVLSRCVHSNYLQWK